VLADARPRAHLARPDPTLPRRRRAINRAAGWGRRAGLRLVQFPFIEDGYLLHLGRGTLREVADGNDTSNRYYDWAIDHRDYHFAGRADGAQLLAAFANVFDEEVGNLTPANLAAACLRPHLLSLA
jgi:hypothetical protein